MAMEPFMQFSIFRIHAALISTFREPVLQLGVRASEVTETFYKALKKSQTISLSDLLTSGGNSYADLKLTINTFLGGGRIDITPGALIVVLRDVHQKTGYAEVAKEHLQLCEDVLREALQGVEISQRLLRCTLWLDCEGGSEAVEAFLTNKGNAALKLDEGGYANWKKEFTFQLNALDVTKGIRVGLSMERSTTGGNLFVQFDHTFYGNPKVTQDVSHQFSKAELELANLMRHIGLQARTEK
jgi:hypothetical protein